ncbi:MAG: flagellar basal-body rod protein FlgG [Phycisphaerales bacterium]
MAVTALHSAATGLNALSTELDVIANNLANVNTTAFKSSRVNFQDLLYLEKKQPGVENINGDERPIGLYVGLGVEVSGTQKDFTQGDAVATGRELDIMIEGNGFLMVSVEDDLGPDGIAYTRAGNLTRNSEGQVVLATDQGRIVQPEITIDNSVSSSAITITADGQVFVKVDGDADPQLVGQLELAAFINPQGLAEVGENLFVATAASGDAITGTPTEGVFGSINQGFLEGSNVDPVKELVSLIKTQRAFELNGQTVKAADETLQIVNNLRRR